MTETTIDKYNNVLYEIIKRDIGKILQYFRFDIYSENGSFPQWKRSSYSLGLFRGCDEENLGASTYYIVLLGVNGNIYESLIYSIDNSYNEWLYETKVDLIHAISKLKFI